MFVFPSAVERSVKRVEEANLCRGKRKATHTHTHIGLTPNWHKLAANTRARPLEANFKTRLDKYRGAYLQVALTGECLSSALRDAVCVFGLNPNSAAAAPRKQTARTRPPQPPTEAKKTGARPFSEARLCNEPNHQRVRAQEPDRSAAAAAAAQAAQGHAARLRRTSRVGVQEQLAAGFQVRRRFGQARASHRRHSDEPANKRL